MLADTSAGLRITVWRPYVPDRPLTIRKGSDDTISVVGPDMQLQQEAFTWQVKEDVWGGLTDSEVRQQLSQKFITEFEPVRPPAQRSLAKLGSLLDELRAADASAEWSSSGQQVHEDGETAVRLNSVLAFLNQLTWLHDVFRDVPGASVSVR